MRLYKIEGGVPLFGSINVHGSKNAVLPVLAATVINGGKNIIHNCPSLSDVDSIIEILKILGCTVLKNGTDVYIDSENVNHSTIPPGKMLQTRSSTIFAGALLARTRQAFIPCSGGCQIGKRPIDIHLRAFRSLGVDVSCGANGVKLCARRLSPGKIILDFPSVGATENIMLLASSIGGATTIENAAREPEISNLADYLRSIGTKIWGDGTNCIKIWGNSLPGAGEVTIIGDRIVASTYASAVACTGGDVQINGVNPRHCSSYIAYLRKMGMKIDCGKTRFTVKKPGRLKNIPFTDTNPYPGFPTDCQPLAISVMAYAGGGGVMRERIFENRTSHCPELCKMGADISVNGRNIFVKGTRALRGTALEAKDLRAGASLAVAAMGAEGISYVSGTGYIDRGYEDLCRDFSLLGARIERID